MKLLQEKDTLVDLFSVGILLQAKINMDDTMKNVCNWR